MAKLMIKAIGLFALTIAYSTGAWAACGVLTDATGVSGTDDRIEVCTMKGPSYASELFGAGSDDLVLGYEADDPDTEMVDEDNQPRVIIEFNTDDGGIATGASAQVTYTLSGAVFAERVGTQFLEVVHASSDDIADNLRRTRTDGGSAGDDFVTFEIEANGAIGPDSMNASMDTNPDDAANPTEDSRVLLVLKLPEVTETAAAMSGLGGGIGVTVDLEASSKLPHFPARGQTWPDQNPRDGETGADAMTDADSGRRTVISRQLSPKGAPLTGLNLQRATAAADATINTEMREMLVVTPPGAQQQWRVAGVTLGETGLDQSDGSRFTVDEGKAGSKDDGDGAGVLVVATEGDFRDGDMLFLSANAKYETDLDTMLEIDGGAATAELDLDESLGTHSVYFVPNGEDPLRSGSITTVFAVAFDQETNVSPRPAVDMIDLKYAGADTALLAYAIAPSSNPDESNIRVRCDSSSDCEVFFACDGADGSGYFGKMAEDIGPRMVNTLQADDLAEIIGAEDEDFMGRMSCEVIGNNINVQVLTRSGDSLVNNTYVGGPLEEQVLAAITAATTAGTHAETAIETATCARLEATEIGDYEADGDATPAMVREAALTAAGC